MSFKKCNRKLYEYEFCSSNLSFLMTYMLTPSIERKQLFERNGRNREIRYRFIGRHLCTLHNMLYYTRIKVAQQNSIPLIATKRTLYFVLCYITSSLYFLVFIHTNYIIWTWIPVKQKQLKLTECLLSTYFIEWTLKSWQIEKPS